MERRALCQEKCEEKKTARARRKKSVPIPLQTWNQRRMRWAFPVAAKAHFDYRRLVAQCVEFKYQLSEEHKHTLTRAPWALSSNWSRGRCWGEAFWSPSSCRRRNRGAETKDSGRFHPLARCLLLIPCEVWLGGSDAPLTAAWPQINDTSEASFLDAAERNSSSPFKHSCVPETILSPAV